MPAELATVKKLFLAALQMPAAQRKAYLDTACDGDTALRQQIEEMLESHQNSGELLSRSPAELLAEANATEADATAAFPPQLQAPATFVDAVQTDAESLSFLTASETVGRLGRLGHYEIHEVIGKGGFGVVLKAFDEKLHRIVAIKVLSPAYAAIGSARKRFIREARAAAAVSHDHVVGIYAVEETQNPPYIVMQCVDGQSLQDKLDKKGPLSLKEILRIGLQTAEGLAAAHRQGLVHRDIKPANILLENGVERVKITDFGLARAVDDASVTQSGTVAGTPMYMSPEQAEGLPIDHRSDLFSLGTVLYAMCTGHPPFRASGTHAVLKRVIDASPRPIREINSEIPDWLCEIVSKLHAKKPEDRFQTAKEVADLLGIHLAHLQKPTLVPKPTTPAPPSSASPPEAVAWTRQRRIGAAAFAVMGVIVSCASVMLFNLPPDRVSPTGVQWLIAGLGLASLLAAVFLAFDSRHRFYTVPCTLVVLGIVLSVLESADVTHFFHTPVYWVELNVDDPKVAFKIVPVVDGADPEATILAHAVRIEWKGKKKLAQRPCRYSFAAFLDERLVYYETVLIDKPRAITINWAAEFTKREKQKLQGAWHAVSGERDGSAIPADMIAAGTFGLRFEGDRVTVRMAQTKVTKATDKEGGFTIDPRKKPATLDLIDAIDGKTIFCVYRFTRDALEICGSPKERPSDFSTKLGSERILFVLKRGEGAPSKTLEEPGWVQLFNGKDLSGWVAEPQVKGVDPAKAWTVKANLLTCTGQPSGCLRTTKSFEDYVLQLEFQFVNPTPNNGQNQDVRIIIHDAPPGTTDKYHRCALFSVDRHGLSWVTGVNVEGPLTQIQGREILLGEWNKVEIRCHDRTIQVSLNGKDVGTLLNRDPAKGHISLYSIGYDLVNFRNIQIRERQRASPEEPGWVQLFNGKDLTGWKTHPKQPDGWKVDKDGVLVGSGPYISHLFTGRDDFTDFHLRAQVKINDQGNSGIYFRVPFDVSRLGMFPTGYEAQILNGLQYNRGNKVVENNLTGSLYGLAPFDKLLVLPDTWFTLEVIAKDNQFVIKVNGQTTVEYRDPERRHVRGHLALQMASHAAPLSPPTVVQFKKIEIKELPPAPKAEAGEPSEDMKPILKGLSDPDAMVRGDTARSLEKLGDKAAVPALLKRLEDDEFGWTKWFSKRRNGVASCKDLAFDALVKVAPEKAAESLHGALRSKNVKGREWACETLAVVKGGEAEAALVIGMMDKEASVRAAAAKAVGKRGEATEATRVRLRALTEDADATVRAASSEALAKVQAKPKDKDSK